MEVKVEEGGTRWRATDTSAAARHRHCARHKTASGARGPLQRVER